MTSSNHLPGHDFGHPRVRALQEKPFEEVFDVETEALFGRQRGIDLAQRKLGVDRAMGVAQHIEVEVFLVAEVVVDRGDIGLGEIANLADGGVAEARLGEDLAGRVEESLARRGLGFAGGGFWELNRHV